MTITENRFNQPVAVVGMAFRFPPDVESVPQLRALLRRGRRTTGPVPQQRWEPHASEGPEIAGVLAKTVSNGSFLDDIQGFDAAFFGIPPREAEVMDPQQRMVLEVVWRALEDAGIPAKSVAGTDAAVFMGVADSDYGRQLLSDLPRVDALRISGGMHYGVANRVSHFYDLHGPSLAIDTACSSSMSAIHLAVQGLQSGQIPLAIAGGSHLMIGPAPLLGLTDAGTTSPDGMSKPFDAEADGYGRGEGVGVLVLKRLADARRDGDRVLATIVGSACNQDGWTPGIMAPSTSAQAHMLRTLYRRIGVDPAAVDYVEAHGTGTAVGDPVEARALADVFGEGRTEDDPCLVGSLKYNLGHLESASGVAGVIKAVLCLQTGVLLPTPSHSGHLHRDVDWLSSGLRMVERETAWPRRDRPRRAGVSSFGAGGTIAHVVLEQADEVLPRHDPPQLRTGPGLFVCSSMSEAGMRDNAGALHEALRSPQPLAGVAHTLMARRSHLAWRGAVIADDQAELTRSLAALSRGECNAAVVSGRTLGADADPVWVFSGQGAHWRSMGDRMLATEPAFSEVVNDLTPIFTRELALDPRKTLVDDDLDDIVLIQAMTFLMHVGLAAVWRSHGLRPAAVVGHSLGEIAAAVEAGVLSLPDGATLACRRAMLMRSARGHGAMVMVALPPHEVAGHLADSTAVTVAVHSSPTSTVISGDTDEVKRWCDRWTADNVFVRSVKTDIASHSAHMDPLLDDIAKATTDLQISEPRIPLYTTALPDPRSRDSRNGAYWQANLRNPVRFAQALTAAAEDGHRIFLEISSHPIVTHSITETFATRGNIEEYAIAYSLRRDSGGSESIVANLAALYCAGARIDGGAARYHGPLVDLPGMAWQHRPFWVTPKLRASGHNPDSHSLLGAPVSIAAPTMERLWETTLDADHRPSPNAHPVQGVDIVAASVLLNTFLDAVRQADRPEVLTGIDLNAALPVEPARRVQVVLRDDAITLYSRLDTADAEPVSWLPHVSARLGAAGRAVDDAPAVPAFAPLPDDAVLDHEELSDLLGSLGVRDVAFDWRVQEMRRGPQTVLARLSLSHPVSEGDWACLLDGAMTTAAVLVLDGHTPRMVTSIQSVAVQERLPASVIVNAVLRDGDSCLDIDVTTHDGTLIAEILGLTFGAIGAQDLEVSSEPRAITHRVSWKEWAASDSPQAPEHVVVVTPHGAAPSWLTASLTNARHFSMTATTVEGLAASLPARGAATAVVVVPPDGDSDVARAAEENTWLLLRAVQMLADPSVGRKNTRLWCLTHAAGVADSATGLTHAPLSGAQRTAAGEHPELWGGHIDVLDPDALDGPTLLTVLSDPTAEDTYRIDGSTVQVSRLAPVRQPASGSECCCRADATYLITGGLGGLGAQTAKYLARRGARRLVLLNRTALPPRSQWDNTHPPTIRDRIAAVRDLETMGVTVRVVVADVADLDRVRNALADATHDMPAIKGVVHTAGTSINHLITRTDRSSLHSVMNPKVAGTLVLDQLFPPGSLDFFILFSSIGQLIRSSGQAGYASANAFQDAFASHRRARGGTDALTLAWPGWRGLGLYTSATDVFHQEMERSGTGDISAATAFRCWNYAERHRLHYAAVLPLSARGTEVDPLPLLRDLARPGTTTGNGATPKKCLEWRTIPADRQSAHLLSEISDEVCQELQIPEEDMDPRRAVMEMGLDSRMALSLRVRLEQRLDIKLPATVFWDHPTLNGVVTYIQGQHSL